MPAVPAIEPVPATPAEGKKAEILAAAAELFSQNGFEGASMRELARSTGISLAGLYHYFPDKEALLYELEKHTFGVLLESARRAASMPATPRQRLRELIRGHVEYFLAQPDAALVLAHEDRSLAGERALQVARLKHAYYEQTRELAAAALPRRLDGARLRATVLSLFGMLNWIPTWHRPGRDLDAQSLSELVCEIFERGAAGATTAKAPASLSKAAAVTSPDRHESSQSTEENEPWQP